MPQWARSVRFRLALMYSVIVFGLAAMIVTGVYVGVSQSLQGEPVSRDIVVRQLRDIGPFVAVEQRVVTQTFVSVERLVNERTLDKLRDLSVLGLMGLFPVSVLIGWLVAGRVLRPIGRITSVAREIQATDLSRRIELQGPDDELRQLADTFDEMLGRIEASAEAQRAFIHETSHELRNPLAVMATNLDVVLADEAATVEDHRSVARIVRRSIDRITTTVDDFLSYARRDVRVMRAGTVDVPRLLEDVAAEFTGPAAERQIEIDVRAAPEQLVQGDDQALRQALENLIGNAVRLAPIASHITVASGSHDGWAWIGVRDEGPGIAPAEQPLVWRRYWRGEVPAGSDSERSGLGLAIVRQVAESHGGRVELHSEPGGSSTFLIWIPITRPPSTPAPPDVPNPLG